MKSDEFNFDGIVGPTHNYAGLSWGNLASMQNKQSTSNPREAALQGLEKMKFLHDLGIKQAVLPPHERPHLPTLRSLGFTGTDAEILRRVQKTDPTLLAAVSSSSAMWAANAATVSPSADSADGRVHITPANLISTFHRSIEVPATFSILKKLFAADSKFAVHQPLPSSATFSDEGAANHVRLSSQNPGKGLQIFTYGRDNQSQERLKFPARQTREASQSIARLHELHLAYTLYFKQTARAIEAGAFHNDVVCVGHQNVLLIHESAWDSQDISLCQAAEAFEIVCGETLHILEIKDEELSLKDAIQSYLFNSQIVSHRDGSMALIAPIESKNNSTVREVIDRILFESNPVVQVHYVDVRQSMRNGGGPACLRLRIELTEPEQAAMHSSVVFGESLYLELKKWIERHYREKLGLDDLADPKLLVESRDALDELSQLLKLGSIYSFQSPT
jgi:succinylarginine dihydrolase